MEKERDANDLLQKRGSIINKTTNALNDIIFALIMLLQYFIMEHAARVIFSYMPYFAYTTMLHFQHEFLVAICRFIHFTFHYDFIKVPIVRKSVQLFHA